MYLNGIQEPPSKGPRNCFHIVLLLLSFSQPFLKIVSGFIAAEDHFRIVSVGLESCLDECQTEHSFPLGQYDSPRLL